jgi:hypothetical protein
LSISRATADEVKVYHVTVQINSRESRSKQEGCRKNIIKEGSSAGLERKNFCIVERKRLLPRVREGSGVQEVVRVTTAR